MTKNIIKELKVHFLHYFILVIILILGVEAFYFLRQNLFFQVVAVLVTSIAYIFWGIVHHYFCDDLHPKIIIEYFLVALIFDAMILSLIFRT